MKNNYLQPEVEILRLQMEQVILDLSNGDGENLNKRNDVGDDLFE